MMQLDNWNDLRYLTAIRNRKSLAAAARSLGVDDTTVSRRLTALQARADAPLYTRAAGGLLELTPLGTALAEQIDGMERHVAIVEQLLDAQHQCCGVVRLSSVAAVANHLLAPRVDSLLREYPHLQLQLIADSRNLNLARREADLAIRMARPNRGGTKLVTRKLAQLTCSVYAMPGVDATALPWIGYEAELSHLAPARWIEETARVRREPLAGLRIHDLETALHAIKCGAGKSVLPDRIAQQHSLTPVTLDTRPPARELWLLMRTDQANLRRIRVVSDWIKQVIQTP